MSEEVEVDPVTGEQTTGHEWNGIKELDTAVPRGILIFIIVTHLFAFGYWVLMPAFPIGWTYTKGLLGINQHEVVEQALVQLQDERASWTQKIDQLPFNEIQADQALMTNVRDSGRQLFGDNCAACHGQDARGRSNYPDLTDGDWLWGDGSPEAIAETLRVGINSGHAETRMAQMPAFGRDAILDRQQVRQAALYIYSLSHPDASTPENIDQIEGGRTVFADNCAGCHGENAQGDREAGIPNLTDQYWLYGGDLETIIETIHGGRAGHMPTWDERLTPTEMKTLALYVHDLGAGAP
ncbi:cytochrome-c oxidase, cbb3-type subunit III [Devosia sp. PTR5]|uniref:Cbb3-type cytochrome c oxidase subunit n=1 Tax=Devosia oryzisoli TaxID=2774138 RepID=A0A927IV03_9HYPH|nr:cytochrome-c oxidase, cbb3-type subunit III [Devosia oryzisoli]MBD8067231.1 cytochrome-c oxidase, cbb3-type subunit III [Devosia oryzisoli]